MADTPTPRSYNAILGSMATAFLSKYGIKKLKKGNPILSILEAAAMSDTRNSQDLFNFLASLSLDSAEGESLSRLGAEVDIARLEESASSSVVTISDPRYTKKATSLYHGKPAPIVGTQTIYVKDASTFPSTGKVFISRGTANLEGPLDYTAKTDLGSYWSITLHGSFLTKRFHNQGETVVLAQGGDRTISASTVVQTPQGNSSSAVQFSLLYSVVIPDGEMEVTGVNVVARSTGSIGNVPQGAISSFVSAPFSQAQVTNPSAISNGQDQESDIDFRARIRNAYASRSLGTRIAILNAVAGAFATDEQKKVTSASIVRTQGKPSTLYIDDGTGYEEKSAGVPIESLNSSSLGGEKSFQLSLGRPVAKAAVESTGIAPFVLTPTSRLAVVVGTTLFEHQFSITDFRAIGNASAYEICASINGNPDIDFGARTAEGGTKVVIFAKVDTNESVQVVSPSEGNDANFVLLFPNNRVDTVRLYKNDRLLSKDGQTAVVTSPAFSEWDSFTGNQTLILAVDGTPAVTYTFTNQDFIDAETGFATVGKNSATAWAAVLNARLPGITTTVDAERLVLTSNKGLSANSSIEITGGTLVSANVLENALAEGADSDYALDRNLGQISLTRILGVGDRLSAGSINSRAFAETPAISPVTLSAEGKLWVGVDVDAEIIPTGVSSAQLFSLSGTPTQFGHRLTLTSDGTPFANVEKGDWMIAWDQNLSDIEGLHRVTTSTSSTIAVEQPEMLAARSEHQALMLNTGMVLAMGGLSITGSTLASCELYNPSTRLWTAAAPMNVPRRNFLALTAPDNKIVVIGGQNATGNLASTEIYDPALDTWTLDRAIPNATRKIKGCFLGGTLFIVGGIENSAVSDDGYTSVYSGSTLATWTSLFASMPTARWDHTVTPLSATTALIAGGRSNISGTSVVFTATVFDLTGGTFTTTGTFASSAGRAGHVAVTLSNGKVLVAGGVNALEVATSTGFIFDPTLPASAWASAASGPSGIAGPTAVRLTSDNKVYVQGNVSSGVHAIIYSADGTTSATAAVNSYMGTSYRKGAVAVALSSTEVLFVGGLFNGLTAASADRYLIGTGFLDPSIVASTGISLSTLGLTIVRADGQLREAAIPAGVNYTASSFVAALDVLGATPKTYRTSRVRLGTNSFDSTGDISILAADTEGQKLPLPSGRIDNTDSHLGSVESGNPEFGTPDFISLRINETSGVDQLSVPMDPSFQTTVDAELPYLPPNRLIRGRQNVTTDFTVTGVDDTFPYGTNASFWSGILDTAADGEGVSVSLRTAAPRAWVPGDRLYTASPYAIGPEDQLVVVADRNETTSRFPINMWRTLTPVSSTYGIDNSFTDADNSDASLVDSFDTDFDFNDFTVYMNARVKSDIATSSKTILWRYKRLGPDGNLAKLRYVYPAAPDTAVAVTNVTLDSDDPFATKISVSLPSDVAKTGYPIRSNSKLGYSASTGGSIQRGTVAVGFTIASAARTTNVTTLTLTMPSGLYSITDHGLSIGDALWVQSTNGSFSSGVKTLTGVTATTISYAETGANATGTTIGAVSYDPAGPINFIGTVVPSAIAVGDLIHLGSAAGIPASWRNQTIRITHLGNQFVQGYTESEVSGESTELNWSTLGDTTKLSFYSVKAATATATLIAASVNALTLSPVSATVLGSGSGTILVSSKDTALVDDTWNQLSDGVNYVKSTQVLSGDYKLLFKNAISSDLVSGADWANDVIKICPTTAKNVKDWLNAPGVSGLFSAATTDQSSSGSKIQIATQTAGSIGAIQVQGGTANSTTALQVGSASGDGDDLVSMASFAAEDIPGFVAGNWVKTSNTINLPKYGSFSTISALTSIDTVGKFTLSAGNVYTARTSFLNRTVLVEKQGNFVALVGAIGSGNSAAEGDWVSITASATSPALTAPNLGIYRVVRIHNETLWIENPQAHEELGLGSFKFVSSNSLLPGDVISINTDVWGVGNRGDWTVLTVGDTGTGNFSSALTFKVDGVTSAKGAVAALSSSGASKIIVTEGTPTTLIKRILSIAPNPSDSSLVDVKFDSGYVREKMAAAGGTVMNALDKLDFSTSIVQGIDGYRYSTGLIGEVNRIEYGDEKNPSVYPGVIAEGSAINIQGPLVKNIQVSLAIRTELGVSNRDIAAKSRSAVVSVINSAKVGTSIAISSVVNAVSTINGVMAVSVLAPTYNSSNDLIAVQPFEKALVLNPDQDVLITFVGE